MKVLLCCYLLLVIYGSRQVATGSGDNCSCADELHQEIAQLQQVLAGHTAKLSNLVDYERKTQALYQWHVERRDLIEELIESQQQKQEDLLKESNNDVTITTENPAGVISGSVVLLETSVQSVQQRLDRMEEELEQVANKTNLWLSEDWTWRQYISQLIADQVAERVHYATSDLENATSRVEEHLAALVSGVDVTVKQAQSYILNELQLVRQDLAGVEKRYSEALTDALEGVRRQAVHTPPQLESYKKFEQTRALVLQMELLLRNLGHEVKTLRQLQLPELERKLVGGAAGQDLRDLILVTNEMEPFWNEIHMPKMENHGNLVATILRLFIAVRRLYRAVQNNGLAVPFDPSESNDYSLLDYS